MMKLIDKKECQNTEESVGNSSCEIIVTEEQERQRPYMVEKRSVINRVVFIYQIRLLTHLFISAVQEKELEKRVVFISSGAAQKAYRGWTHYCSTKAGLDMLMQAIALEQSDRERPVRVAAFNPGRIETDMQKLLREQSPEDFPAVDDFVAAATDGRTGSPRGAARKLAGLVLSADYPHGRTVRASELTG